MCECSVLCAAEVIWCTSATYSCLSSGSSLLIQILLQVRLGAPQGLQRIPVTFGDCWCKIFTGQMPFLSRNQHCQCLDLHLDSSQIQVDALYHTLTPFLSVESCWLSLLPGKSHLLQILDYTSPICSWSAWSLVTRNFPVWCLLYCVGCWWSIRSTCPSQCKSSFCENAVNGSLPSST